MVKSISRDLPVKHLPEKCSAVLTRARLHEARNELKPV